MIDALCPIITIAASIVISRKDIFTERIIGRDSFQGMRLFAFIGAVFFFGALSATFQFLEGLPAALTLSSVIDSHDYQHFGQCRRRPSIS
jgi:hypothetical protein